MVLLVGLTGVGKSTAVGALRAAVPAAAVLPNRRELADRIVIPEAQRLAGETERPVRDRLERFRLTAGYRQAHAGGLAHALERYLHHAELPPAPLLLFDNLRGESEVRFAASAFPSARFIVLEAPPEVRVLRLAGRRDAFDRVSGAAAQESAAGRQDGGVDSGVDGGVDGLRRRLLEVRGLARLTDVAALAAAARGLDPDAVLTGALVVAEESGHYDPAAAWACLQGLPPPRRIRIDTGRLEPAQVAARIRAWL